MPRTVLSPSQIDDLPQLVAQLGSRKAAARALGVTPATLGFHLRGGKANQAYRRALTQRTSRAAAKSV